jgi:hypothetical protein
MILNPNKIMEYRHIGEKSLKYDRQQMNVPFTY